ncbi:crotonobetainyl-CoA:carnitine CoA-transferase CaiB-like acyl-CoA transferase [Novosphingobium sp. SG751A]|uniref:CaiB/BaiF CoA transferase family protein n=1 Tax=Novosphingobium sp. SG751A TaxID=2587000 RepID=UPI0015545C12|nr:CoA transferase [Novosphingobium sp. SG751A]NOW46295.1 crotonobetainyl-CoA:carnitine CoA-transferase CaiB-like acyl-CoA transferase [Novosphingobium sp. SG751A]
MMPLSGIRVLDFTHAIAGPTATMTLAQLGAEVIKIEPPQKGDDFRHYTEHAGLPGMSVPFAAVNAGKRSLALNLKDARGVAIARDLAAQVDVVVENFRPGVMARLGLGFEALSALNPRLIWLSLSGFGQSGDLKDRGAYDHIAQATSGMAMMNATADGPLKIGIPVVDSFTGYLGAMGVLAALRRRDMTGTGEKLDVAMIDAALKIMGASASVWDYTGASPKGTGNRGFRLVATSEYYACADGWIALGANHQHQIEALFAALGAGEMIHDPRFVDHRARVEHYAALKGWLTQEMLKYSAQELDDRLTQAGVPAARIGEIGDILSTPHIAQRGLISRARLPGHDRPLAVLGLGMGPDFCAGGDAGAVPVLGADGDAVLEQMGMDAAAIAILRMEGVIG